MFQSGTTIVLGDECLFCPCNRQKSGGMFTKEICFLIRYSEITSEVYPNYCCPHVCTYVSTSTNPWVHWNNQ